jgi:hypothetical protein
MKLVVRTVVAFAAGAAAMIWVAGVLRRSLQGRATGLHKIYNAFSPLAGPGEFLSTPGLAASTPHGETRRVHIP